jgi:hypothetical protein
MPLPEGRLAVRRALLATADQTRRYAAAGRAPWRRAGLWLSMAAVAAVVVGAFGLGAGALNALVPPTSPVYSLRLVLDQARGVFLLGHPNPGQYALGYQFPAVQLPAAGRVTGTANGKIGGLPATLTLTGAETCATGGPCGRFVVSLAGLSTRASAKFGELKGTFACAPGGCTLALNKATGVFAQVSTSRVPVSAARATEGRLSVKMASRGDWVAAVATAAYALQTDGMLPEGMTTSDLVGKAAADDQTTRGGGGPNGRVEKNTPSSAAGKVTNDETGTSGSRRAPIWMTAPTPRVSTPTGTGIAGGAQPGGNTGPNASPNGQGSGVNGSGGAPTSNGSTVGGGVTVNDNASTGNGGVGVTGGTSVDAGASTGSGGVGGGASVDAGASTSGGVNVGGGATVDAGASTGSGGVNVGGGASVNGGASTNNGGVGTGGGANVNAGGSGGSGGSTAGGGANVNAGGSGGSGGSTAGGGANVNAGGGVNVNGGVGGTGGSVNVNGGSVNVNGGSVNVDGGVGGGGGSGGSSGAGNGSH